MPRPKKSAEIVTRTFYLDADGAEVEVTVKGPRKAVRLSASDTSLFIVTGETALPQEIGAPQRPAAIGYVDAPPVVPSTNRDLPAHLQGRFAELQAQGRAQRESTPSQGPTAAEKQQAILDDIGAPDLLKELQEMTIPDA